jgi:hypothetical protein
VEPVSLKNHKIIAYNNIKTITVDITNADWREGTRSSGSEIVSCIIRASGGTTQKLIVYAKATVLTSYGGLFGGDDGDGDDDGLFGEAEYFVEETRREVEHLVWKITERLGPALKPKWKLMPDQGMQCWTWEDLDELKCSYPNPR